jgi:lipopolysaccharide assembly outer membrane protein LptD (OstA)
MGKLCEGVSMRRIPFALLVLVAIAAGLVALVHAQVGWAKTVMADRIMRDSRSQTLTGHVTIIMAGITIHADEAIYTPATNDLELRGSVHVTPVQAPDSGK